MLMYYTIVFETADCLIIACSVMQKHVLRLTINYVITTFYAIWHQYNSQV